MELFITYQELKVVILAKNLTWQYYESTGNYLIWASESSMLYVAKVYKSGFEPPGTDVTQNTNDRNDFENNYKTTANGKISQTDLMSAATGTITANGQTVVCAVYGVNSCSMSISGTYSNVSIAFEISTDNQTTWFPVNGASSDFGANFGASVNSATDLTRMYYFNFGMATHFRARCTAFASGTVNVKIIPGNAADNCSVVVGDVLHGASESGLCPVKVGGQARTTNPTAVSDGARANLITDDLGRLVVVSNHVRDLVTQNTITLSNSSEQTLLTAGGAGVFHDITYMSLTNTSASAVRVDIRDASAGTVRWAVHLPAASNTQMPFTVPVKQTTVNNDWTAQLSATVNNVRVFVQAVKNV